MTQFLVTLSCTYQTVVAAENSQEAKLKALREVDSNNQDWDIDAVDILTTESIMYDPNLEEN